MPQRKPPAKITSPGVDKELALERKRTLLGDRSIGQPNPMRGRDINLPLEASNQATVSAGNQMPSIEELMMLLQTLLKR